MQASGDHQVQDQPEVAFQSDGDALAKPAQPPDDTSFDGVDGRMDGAQQEWRREADTFERLTENPFFQRFDIDRDVG